MTDFFHNMNAILTSFARRFLTSFKNEYIANVKIYCIKLYSIILMTKL